MTIAEIKSRIKDKIDTIEDRETLQHYFDLIDNESSDSGYWNNLSEEKKADIEKAYKEAENDEGDISHEEMMKRVSGWISR